MTGADRSVWCCQMQWRRQVSTDVRIAEAEVDPRQNDPLCQYHRPMLQVITNCYVIYITDSMFIFLQLNTHMLSI